MAFAACHQSRGGLLRRRGVWWCQAPEAGGGGENERCGRLRRESGAGARLT